MNARPTSRYRRRWQKFLAVTSVIAGLALIVPMVALACPGRSGDNTGVYLYGWVRDTGNTFDNIQSEIQARNPNLPSDCLTWKCTSYAWVMLTTQNATYDIHAQYGPYKGYYVHTPSTQIGPGADYTQCANTHTGDVYDKYVTTTTVGNSPNYKIKFGTDPDGQSANKIFVRDGTTEDWCGGHGGNDPFTFTPNEADGAVEIYDISAQIPGSQSTHEQFNSATVHDTTSGTLDLFAGSPGLVYNPSHKTWMGSESFAVHQNYDFWDDDCP